MLNALFCLPLPDGCRLGVSFSFLPKKLWGRGWSVVMQVPNICAVQLGFFALYLFLTPWDLFFSSQCMRVFSLPWHRNNILQHVSVQEILYPAWGGKALISTNSIVFISMLTLGVIGTKLFGLGPRHWLVLLVPSYVTASPQGPDLPDFCSWSYFLGRGWDEGQALRELLLMTSFSLLWRIG